MDLQHTTIQCKSWSWGRSAVDKDWAGHARDRRRAGAAMTHAATKAARQRRIVELLSQQPVRSQVDLAELLAHDGLLVTQATLSRDLVELDAVRVRGVDGVLVYAVPGEGGDQTPHAAAEATGSSQRLARL